MKKKGSKISYRDMLGAQLPAEPPPPSAPASTPVDATPLLASDRPLSAEEIAARLNRRLTPGEGMPAVEGPADPPATRPRLKRGGPSPRRPDAGAPAVIAAPTAPPNEPDGVAGAAARRESAAAPPPDASPFPDDAPAAIPDIAYYDPSISLRERLHSGAGSVELLMFRVGPELFAASLASVEEVVETPDIHRLPEMPDSMLGVFKLRERLLPVYSPTRVLGTELAGPPAATLVIRSSTGEGRIGLAVDDVEDVLVLAVTAVRDAPGTDDADGVLLGVTARGTDLVAVVDADALIAACVTEGITEFS